MLEKVMQKTGKMRENGAPMGAERAGNRGKVGKNTGPGIGAKPENNS